MLADDAWLIQSSHPRRAGAAEVGMLLGIHARNAPGRVAPAGRDGREVIAFCEDPQAVKASDLMWLERTAGRISFIRDYRYVRCVVDKTELVLARDGAPAGEGNAPG
jgi:hypothetical protein